MGDFQNELSAAESLLDGEHEESSLLDVVPTDKKASRNPTNQC
ncbi:hypothetical protein [Streptomyces sp. NPDC056632]